jgi:hypothetical protein
MLSRWYDPFYWNNLLSDWCVHDSHWAEYRPDGTWPLALQQLLRLCS